METVPRTLGPEHNPQEPNRGIAALWNADLRVIEPLHSPHERWQVTPGNAVLHLYSVQKRPLATDKTHE